MRQLVGKGREIGEREKIRKGSWKVYEEGWRDRKIVSSKEKES